MLAALVNPPMELRSISITLVAESISAENMRNRQYEATQKSPRGAALDPGSTSCSCMQPVKTALKKNPLEVNRVGAALGGSVLTVKCNEIN